MPRTTPPLVVLTFLLAMPVRATPRPLGGNEALPQESFPLSRPLAAGTVTRSSVGDYDGNGEPDAVLLTTSGIEIVVDPGSVSWWLQTTTPANDVSDRPRPAEATHDRFVMVDSTGAKVGWMVSNQLQTVAIQTGDWAGALLVDSALTDVGGSVLEERIVGVMNDGVSLEVLSSNGAAWTSNAITLGTALPGDPNTIQIVELELLDLDGDGAVEIALGCQDADDCGVAFYELDGTAILPWYGDSDHTLTSLTSGAQANGTSFCAWTTQDSSGAEAARACTASGLATYVPLGAAGVVGAATATWTDDGHADLVLSLSTGDLRVLTNLGTTAPSFALSNYTAIAPSTTQTNNAAQPLCGDVDWDGDVDLLLALEDPDELEVHRNGIIDHELTWPAVDPALDNETEPSTAMAEDPGCGPPLFTSSHLVHSIAVDAGSTTATHVAYKVWRRGSLGGNTTTPPDTGVEELDNGALVLQIELEYPNTQQSCSPPDCVYSSVLYYYELQLVEWTGTEWIHYSPALYGVQTDDSSSDNAEHLASIRKEGPWYVYYGTEPPISNYDPVVVGTYDQIRFVPGLPEGSPTE